MINPSYSGNAEVAVSVYSTQHLLTYLEHQLRMRVYGSAGWGYRKVVDSLTISRRGSGIIWVTVSWSFRS